MGGGDFEKRLEGAALIMCTVYQTISYDISLKRSNFTRQLTTLPLDKVPTESLDVL